MIKYIHKNKLTLIIKFNKIYSFTKVSTNLLNMICYLYLILIIFIIYGFSLNYNLTVSYF